MQVSITSTFYAYSSKINPLRNGRLQQIFQKQRLYNRSPRNPEKFLLSNLFLLSIELTVLCIDGMGEPHRVLFLSMAFDFGSAFSPLLNNNRRKEDEELRRLLVVLHMCVLLPDPDGYHRDYHGHVYNHFPFIIVESLS